MLLVTFGVVIDGGLVHGLAGSVSVHVGPENGAVNVSCSAPSTVLVFAKVVQAARAQVTGTTARHVQEERDQGV